ncbi:hypothetical protein KNSL1_013720 [Colletotrichum chrysophilum]|nr:hypothetical protein KNSL1_013720 [Colletotrichum chrysophilum]
MNQETFTMTDEEFAELLSMPLNDFSMPSSNSDPQPAFPSIPTTSSSLSESPSSIFDLNQFGTSTSTFGLYLSSFTPQLPQDMSIDPLWDLGHCARWPDFGAEESQVPRTASQLPTKTTESASGTQGKKRTGSDARIQPLFDLVQTAMSKMIAQQEEHNKGVIEKQKNQNRQLQDLSDKLDHIREGLDSFSADVWRWTRPTGLEYGEELNSSDCGYSDMSGVALGYDLDMDAWLDEV